MDGVGSYVSRGSFRLELPVVFPPPHESASKSGIEAWVCILLSRLLSFSPALCVIPGRLRLLAMST